MNQTELRKLQRVFQRKYATKRLYPLRFPNYQNCSHLISHPAEDFVVTKTKYFNRLKEQVEEWKNQWQPLFIQVTLCMKGLMTKGSFGFLFDRRGSRLVVIKVLPAAPASDLELLQSPGPPATKPALPLEVGSIVVSIDDQPIRFDPEEIAENLFEQDQDTLTEEDRQEVVRKAMVKVFVANGIETSRTKVFCLKTMRAPEHCDYVTLINETSKFKRKSSVALSLSRGYVNFFSSWEKATTASDKLLRRNAMQVEELTFRVIYSNPACYEFELLHPPRRRWHIKVPTIDQLVQWSGALELAQAYATGTLNMT